MTRWIGLPVLIVASLSSALAQEPGLDNPAPIAEADAEPEILDVTFSEPIQFTGIWRDLIDVTFAEPIQFTGISENDISRLENYLEELIDIDVMFEEWISATGMAQSLRTRSADAGEYADDEIQNWLSDELRWLFLEYQDLELWHRNYRNITALREAISELRFEPDQDVVQAGMSYFDGEMPAWRERYADITRRYTVCVLEHMELARQAYGESRRLWSAPDFNSAAYDAAFASYEAERSLAGDCVDETTLDDLTREPVFEWPMPM